MRNRIAMYRKEKGMSQEHLAMKLGMSRERLSAIENDRAEISLFKADFLARLFGCSIYDLFTCASDGASLEDADRIRKNARAELLAEMFEQLEARAV